MQDFQIPEHFAGVGGDVRDVVDLADDADWIDEERMPLRIVVVPVAGRAGNFVLASDDAVDVAEQRIAETLSDGEVEIFRRSVERGADDEAVGGGEANGAVTQRLTLNRSTRRRRLGIPPQQDPVAAQIGEPDDVALLIRQGELGSCDSGGEHAPMIGRQRVAREEAGSLPSWWLGMR